jgi:hypothetical protein
LDLNLVLLILGIFFGAIASISLLIGIRHSLYLRKQVKLKPTITTKQKQLQKKKVHIPQKKTVATERFCENCYAIIPENLEFCNKCGAKQD